MSKPTLLGTYRMPACNRGDLLADEYLGRDRQVGGIADTPIQWPYAAKGGTRSPIVCGDLIRAIETESSAALQYYWGVGPVTAWKWRQSLGVQRMTAGTQEVYREVMPARLSPEKAAAGRAQAASPEVRARLSATRRGKPAHPNTRQALLAAAKRPASIRHRYALGIANGGTRRSVLANLRRKGLTLQAIADAIGLTKEGVRLAAGPGIGVAAVKRRKRREREAQKEAARQEQSTAQVERKKQAILRGLNVRIARRRIGMSQQALAALAGRSQPRIANIERDGCSQKLMARLIACIQHH